MILCWVLGWSRKNERRFLRALLRGHSVNLTWIVPDRSLIIITALAVLLCSWFPTA